MGWVGCLSKELPRELLCDLLVKLDKPKLLPMLRDAKGSFREEAPAACDHESITTFSPCEPYHK